MARIKDKIKEKMDNADNKAHELKGRMDQKLKDMHQK